VAPNLVPRAGLVVCITTLRAVATQIVCPAQTACVAYTAGMIASDFPWRRGCCAPTT